VARVFVAFHPRRKTERPLLYEDLIAMNQAGQNASVSKIIEMIDDLRAHGRNSRYVKHLGDILYELKARTAHGGARVYFFRLNQDGYVLVRAEIKQEDWATEALLIDTLDVAEAVEKGTARLVPRPRRQGGKTR
jgi:phage-related protein